MKRETKQLSKWKSLFIIFSIIHISTIFRPSVNSLGPFLFTIRDAFQVSSNPYEFTDINPGSLYRFICTSSAVFLIDENLAILVSAVVSGFVLSGLFPIGLFLLLDEATEETNGVP